MAKSFYICIGTYNEAENIIPLFKKIEAAVKEIPDYEFQVLVIDDNSPDGTGKLVKEYQPQASIPIHLIENPGKGGLGKAYIQGFKYAIERGAFAVCEMDGDHSHNPIYLKDICKALETNDMVIGSRYVKGGGVVNWNLKRKFMSRAGSLYARIITGVPVNDFTGGYNCFRVTVFDKVNLDEIKSVGYSFMIETKYKVVKAGLKFQEVPIIFVDREFGESKLSGSVFREALKIPWKLRLGKI